MNKVLTRADKLQKIAELKKIPQQMLPSTLKYQVHLPNIKKIYLEYRDQSKDIGPAFQFLRKYTADIKYHNPDIIIERNRSDDGPIKLNFLVFTKNSQEPISIDPSEIAGPEKLRQQLEAIGKVVV